MTIEEAKNKVNYKKLNSCFNCRHLRESEEIDELYCCSILSGLVGEEVAVDDFCHCDCWSDWEDKK